MESSTKYEAPSPTKHVDTEEQLESSYQIVTSKNKLKHLKRNIKPKQKNNNSHRKLHEY